MKIDIKILLDSIYGRLRQEDACLLEDWLNSDIQHRIYYEQLKARELNIDSKEAVDQEKYRQAFANRLKETSAKKQYRKRKIGYAVLGIAASVMIIVALKIFGPEQQPQAVSPGLTVDNTDITAQKLNKKTSNKKVKLITAQGKEISILDIGVKDTVKENLFHLSPDKMSMTYVQNNPNATIGNELKNDSLPLRNNIREVEKLNMLIVDRGAEFKITLSDGTIVHLNSDSWLKYPTKFNGKERRVFVAGEAYFDVAKDREKPFVVCSGETEVKVLGTTFNINSRNPQQVTTTLVKGTVSVKSPKTVNVKLTPGETAIINPIEGSIDVTDRDIQYYIGWQTGNYLFERTKLSDILNELAIWYDISFDYQTEEASRETFSGSLSRDLSISKLIQLIEKTNHIKLDLRGKKLTVKSQELTQMVSSVERN